MTHDPRDGVEQERDALRVERDVLKKRVEELERAKPDAPGLCFSELQRANAERQAEWDPGKSIDLAYRAMELAGAHLGLANERADAVRTLRQREGLLRVRLVRRVRIRRARLRRGLVLLPVSGGEHGLRPLPWQGWMVGLR
jgi:hypothetical protein